MNKKISITDKIFIAGASGMAGKSITNLLKKNGFRAHSDLRNEKITYKIRDHSLQETPFLLIAGNREMENNTIAVRARGGEDLGEMSIDSLIQMLQQTVYEKK